MNNEENHNTQKHHMKTLVFPEKQGSRPPHESKSKSLTDSIIKASVNSYDDLELKASLILKMLESGHLDDVGINPTEILTGLLHDVMCAYAEEKSKFDGSYGESAAQTYHKLFYHENKYY